MDKECPKATASLVVLVVFAFVGPALLCIATTGCLVAAQAELDSDASLTNNGKLDEALLDTKKWLSFKQTLELLEQSASDGIASAATIAGGVIKDGERLELADLIELAHWDKTKCNEAHFRRLVGWRQQLDKRTPLSNYLRTALKEQRRFCYDFLNKELGLVVASFGELTSVHLELFRSQDRIGHDFYVNPDSSIQKLRSLVKGSLKAPTTEAEASSQRKRRLELAQDFLLTCREITTKLKPLVPIRNDHDMFARLPPKQDNYFRAYEFCRNLIEFDFDNELGKLLFQKVPARQIILGFGKTLESLAQDGGSANNKLGEEQSIARAAYNFAQDMVRERQRRLESNYYRHANNLKLDHHGDEHLLELALDHLRSSCIASLDLTENLLWLRELDLRGFKPDQQSSRTQRLVRYLTACKQLADMDNHSIKDQNRKHNRFQKLMQFLSRGPINLRRH